MTTITIEKITKNFGRYPAVDQVSLTVEEGEFLTILGPSGSGKTTLLRLIAGLEVPDAGQIRLGRQIVCGQGVWVAPQKRAIGMVFQNYALWPHMTAFENIAFPLEDGRLGRAQIQERVEAMIDLVELAGLEAKRPGQMSGGEQQRVALGRALVGQPAILLMDECLSNLDARLREKMAAELRQIQRRIGITTLYVTHDQQEALALSDRIAVLHQGRLQQVGSPETLYRRAANALVAKALGSINLLTPVEARRLGLEWAGDSFALLGVRPEALRLVPPASAKAPSSSSEIGILGRVTKVTFMGQTRHYQVVTNEITFQVIAGLAPDGRDFKPQVGDEVGLLSEPEAWLPLSET